MCTNFVEEVNVVDAGNFAQMLTMAIQMERPQIADKFVQFILDEFAQIRHCPEFRSLPMDYLKKILASPRLKVNEESEVVDTIIQWIKDEPEKRSELIQLIGEVVRLDQLESKNLMELVMPMDRQLLLSPEDGRSFHGIRAALQRRTSPEDSTLEMTDDERRMMRPRDSTAGILMLAGGMAAEYEGTPGERGMYSSHLDNRHLCRFHPPFARTNSIFESALQVPCSAYRGKGVHPPLAKWDVI